MLIWICLEIFFWEWIFDLIYFLNTHRKMEIRMAYKNVVFEFWIDHFLSKSEHQLVKKFK